ncbi:MAG TPA: methylmalonyl-CoA epimerase, partial [Myxococcales bacterium]|nr:methylmalonyl-CoA epimerase [Myxococcales bacterium]
LVAFEKSIDEISKFIYDLLYLALLETKEMPERGLRIAFLKVGEVLLELLQPLHENSEISRFLEKRGEGIHHLCFQVDDIAESLSTLKEDGVRLINEEPVIGAEGCPVAFLHPKSCHGVLLELLEESPST